MYPHDGIQQPPHSATTGEERHPSPQRRAPQQPPHPRHTRNQRRQNDYRRNGGHHSRPRIPRPNDRCRVQKHLDGGPYWPGSRDHHLTLVTLRGEHRREPDQHHQDRQYQPGAHLPRRPRPGDPSNHLHPETQARRHRPVERMPWSPVLPHVQFSIRVNRESAAVLQLTKLPRLHNRPYWHPSPPLQTRLWRRPDCHSSSPHQTRLWRSMQRRQGQCRVERVAFEPDSE